MYLSFIFYVIKEDLQDFWNLIKRVITNNDKYKNIDDGMDTDNIYYENIEEKNENIGSYGTLNSNSVWRTKNKNYDVKKWHFVLVIASSWVSTFLWDIDTLVRVVSTQNSGYFEYVTYYSH